jgi:hypothetical protein
MLRAVSHLSVFMLCLLSRALVLIRFARPPNSFFAFARAPRAHR